MDASLPRSVLQSRTSAKKHMTIWKVESISPILRYYKVFPDGQPSTTYLLPHFPPRSRLVLRRLRRSQEFSSLSLSLYPLLGKVRCIHEIGPGNDKKPSFSNNNPILQFSIPLFLSFLLSPNVKLETVLLTFCPAFNRTFLLPSRELSDMYFA